jgi:hypothetical protein
VDAVGAALLDEIRAVVEDEEGAVLVAGGAKRASRGYESLVAELLVTELDDVDAAA